MIDILQSLAAVAELGLLAAGAMHLKVKGSSVLVHMLGSHRKGLDDPKANRIAAEGVGILTLNIDSEAYRAEHGLHHGLRSFARPHADPDATLIHDLGFRPGVPLSRLRRLVWWTMVSPRFHLRLGKARLRGVFAAGPPLRIAAAWVFWGALLIGAAAGGWLLPLLLGFVLPLLVFGNIGSFLELASEHVWGIEAPEGRARQAQLSHARLPGAMPPKGRNALAWAAWMLQMTWAAFSRFAVVPGDLPHHDAHHIGERPALQLDRHAWTNAAAEFSPSLWADADHPRNAVASIGQAIERWLVALAAEASAPDGES